MGDVVGLRLALSQPFYYDIILVLEREKVTATKKLTIAESAAAWLGGAMSTAVELSEIPQRKELYATSTA